MYDVYNMHKYSTTTTTTVQYTYMYMCTTIITEVSFPYKLLANMIRVKFTDLL